MTVSIAEKKETAETPPDSNIKQGKWTKHQLSEQ